MRNSRNRMIVVVVLVVLGAVAWTGLNFLRAYGASHPDVVIPNENRQRFVHACVLIDPSGSVKAENLEAAKQIVANGIIPACGLEDTLVVYTVGPGFTIANTIFGRTQDEQPFLPSAGDREHVFSVVNRNRESSQHGVVDEDMYDLLRYLEPHWQRLETVRAQWRERLAQVQRPRVDGSEICAALKSIEQDFRSQQDRDADKVLFVFSDFLQDARNVQSCEPVAGDGFDDVRVVLVYPYDSDQNWQKVQSDWSTFFGDQEPEMLPLSDAQRRRLLLKPNPLSGLERIQPESFWDAF